MSSTGFALASTGLGAYAVGVGAAVLMLGSLGWAAYWLRRWLLPTYGGALARLAEAVLGLALLLLALELLGSFGGLRAGWMVAAAAVLGLGAGLTGRRLAGPPAAEPAPAVPGWALAVALAIAAVAVGEWSFPSLLDLNRGIFSGDSTWYHLPFATRFAQSHSTWSLLHTDPLALATWFYPASSELLNGAAVVLFHSDWLSPLFNLAWLALALLAAYCVGRPFGVGPATLAAAALALDSGLLRLTQAGEARNDAMALALLLAFAALLVSAWRERGTRPLLVAGLAGGLAASVKLTMLAPVGTVTVVVLAALALGGRSRGRRLAGLGALLGGELIAGSYWYLRNLAHSGNPVPQVHGIGPIALPYPHQMDLYPRPPNSVAHYLFDGRVIRVWFLPKLLEALGPLYPLILLAALAAAIWAIAASRSAVLAGLGIAAIVTAVVYVFTPLTAAGPPGQPHGFLTNLRYLLPGVALGLVLLPLPPRLRGPRARPAVLCLLVAAFAVSVAATGVWEARFLAGAAFLAAAVAVLPACAGWLRSRGRLTRPLAAALALFLLVPAAALGHAAQVGYVARHYSLATLRAQEPGLPVRIMAWARDQHDQRIALAGAGELFFDQSIYAGADDSNWVQYVGQPGPHGAYLVPPSCRDFRRLLARGRYDYVVVTRFGDNSPRRRRDPLAAWLSGDPGLKLLRTETAYPQPAYLYRVTGPLDPGGCRA